MVIEFRAFANSDYLQARALWEGTPGVGLSDADASDAIKAFLARNPGTSFVALEGSVLVGTVLCGHDGRRGLIHHLVTAQSHRRQGIATSLLRAGLNALRGCGIDKCNLLVFCSNEDGLKFWRSVAAQERTELALFSMATNYAG
jgi:ribosomal protein S18 acetylase RimI-like enzyme